MQTISTIAVSLATVAALAGCMKSQPVPEEALRASKSTGEHERAIGAIRDRIDDICDRIPSAQRQS